MTAFFLYTLLAECGYRSLRRFSCKPVVRLFTKVVSAAEKYFRSLWLEVLASQRFIRPWRSQADLKLLYVRGSLMLLAAHYTDRPQFSLTLARRQASSSQTNTGRSLTYAFKFNIA